MFASTLRRGNALACCMVVAVCVILSGCKEETPKPSAPGYYDGPMKPKAGPAADKTGSATPKGNAAGEP